MPKYLGKLLASIFGLSKYLRPRPELTQVERITVPSVQAFGKYLQGSLLIGKPRSLPKDLGNVSGSTRIGSALHTNIKMTSSLNTYLREIVYLKKREL
jgi:hypothetical protein